MKRVPGRFLLFDPPGCVGDAVLREGGEKDVFSLRLGTKLLMTAIKARLLHLGIPAVCNGPQPLFTIFRGREIKSLVPQVNAQPVYLYKLLLLDTNNYTPL